MRRVVLTVFGTLATLVGLLSYKTHPTTVAAATVSTDTGGAPTPSTPAPATSGPATYGPAAVPSTGSSTAASTATSRTVTGNAVDTRWGPVQVRITVTNGRITAATAVVYPQNNGRDQEINAYAVPQLEQESIGRSTSTIDMVSGATYTSTGYIQSLQSALDMI